VLQALVLGLKFAGKSHLDQMLGALLAAAIQGDPQLTDVDALVPVPLHWRRRLRRGYNQAQLLAQAAANQLPHLHVEPFLIRTRDTVPQATLATTDRLRNLKGAFAARPNAKIAGKHLCLVDDVTTTGTTLRIAARALRRAGAAKVSAVVIAVAAN
jgi:ComF family protein